TWRQAPSPAACACPATQFQPSAIPADRRLDSAAGFATFPTARPLPRSGGRQSHPASEAAGDISRPPACCQTTRRTPETSEDNQSQRRDALAGFPSLNAIRGTDVCEGDTHLVHIYRATPQGCISAAVAA